MADLIKIGSSGVRVNQLNLQTTGHNIANVDTDGYSRQDAVQVTNPAIAWGNGHYGQGARTETVRRIVNDFTVNQLRNDTSVAKEREMVLQYAKQLDNLMADADSSPGNALNEFFSAMQSLADDPNNSALRNQVLAQADGLAQRFNLMQERFDDMQESINVQLKSSVGDINRIAANIADLNRAVVEAEGKNGLPANDLRDAREEQLRELSEYVDVSLTKVADGTYSVFIGEGFPLVVHNENYPLAAEPLSSDIKRLGIVYPQRDGDKNVTHLIQGGELGGVLKFRDEIMTPAQNQLGRLALTIAETFNQQHQKGIDLNNQTGKNFFTDVNSTAAMEGRVSAFKDNSQSSNIRFNIEITDTTALSDKDYVLKAVGPDTFSLFDTDGNQLRFEKNTTPKTFTTTVTLEELNRQDGTNSDLRLSVDGFDIYLSTDAAKRVAQGDQFLIQPARYASGQMAREITSPDEIAIASPLRIESALFNEGSAEVKALSVLSTYKSGIADTKPLLLADSPNPNGAAPETSSYIFVDERDGSFKVYLDTPASTVTGSLAGTDIPTAITAGGTANSRTVADSIAAAAGAPVPASDMDTSVFGAAFTAADAVADSEKDILDIAAEVQTLANAEAAVPGATADTVAEKVKLFLEEQGASSQVVSDAVAGIKSAPNAATAAGAVSWDVGKAYLREAFESRNVNSGAIATTLAEVDTAKAASIAAAPAYTVLTQADMGAFAEDAANEAALAQAARLTTPPTGLTGANAVGGAAATGIYDLKQGVNISFTSESATTPGQLQYEITDPDSGAIIYQGTYTKGQENALLPASWGIDVSIGGNPAVGDRFTVAFNTDGAGDNSNALLLTGLQGEPTLEGEMSYQDAYAKTVSQVGSQTSEAKITAQSGAAILEQTTNLRDSVSGVNLDEEAANLVRFQQAYNASSQVISMAKQMFDTLLAAVR